MLGIAFRGIETWLKKHENQPAEIREEITDLRTCLAYFEESLYAIDAEVSKALHGPAISEAKANFGTKRKMKFLWNEDIMRGHLDEVKARRSAFGFAI